MNRYLSPLKVFWQEHPALLYGISFYAGIVTNVWILITLILPFICNLRKAFLILLLFLSAGVYSNQNSSHPELPEEGLQGTGLFQISNISQKEIFSQKTWIYTGKLISFQELENIPVTLQISNSKLVGRPLANYDYWIEGKLSKTSTGKYYFKPDKNTPWQPDTPRWNLLEHRLQAKQQVKHYISRKISKEPSKSFLSGMITGEFDNRLMSFHFSRFGLQHILAISGFHFAITAALLNMFLSWIMDKKYSIILLMTMMTLYFLFLGPSPSILRAWVSCMIGFGAFLLEKQSSALNTLGIGLLVTLVYDPALVENIGFQFSFAVTAAILLFYSPVDFTLKQIFPPRTLRHVVEMNGINQQGFVLLTLFRQALSLSIAVNIVAIPISLFYFQKFSLMGILYNFFFPWMSSLSMALLFTGMLVDFIHPLLGEWIHQANVIFTQFILDYAYTLPRHLDLHLRGNVNKEISGTILITSYVIGIYFRSFLQKKNALEPIKIIF